MGLLPARYQRNRQGFTIDQQLKLFRSRVAVIGSGGLGGYVIEELARLGIGTIVAVDPDVFVEHNLNRQLLSTPEMLGYPKVKAARERVGTVNPAVTLIAHHLALTRANGRHILNGVDLAVDALDNLSTRLDLAEECEDLKIPLVHGAIGGWYGVVLSQMPGDRTLQETFANIRSKGGIEKQLGNPSFTPAVIASLEVAEVCKILLGIGDPLRKRILTVDLLTMQMEDISLMDTTSNGDRFK